MAQTVVIKRSITWLQNNIKSWEPAVVVSIATTAPKQTDDNLILTREMVLSEEDRILIKKLYYFKGYDAKRLISEFPAQGWKKTTVNDFLKHMREIECIQ